MYKLYSLTFYFIYFIIYIFNFYFHSLQVKHISIFPFRRNIIFVFLFQFFPHIFSLPSLKRRSREREPLASIKGKLVFFRQICFGFLSWQKWLPRKQLVFTLNFIKKTIKLFVLEKFTKYVFCCLFSLKVNYSTFWFFINVETYN